MTLYATWTNVVANDKGDPVVDRDPRNRCRHCLNLGIVILDDTTNQAAPCPMCMLGGRRSVEWATGRLAPRTMGCAADDPPPITHTGQPAEHYWHGADLSGVSWSHGLTIRHDRVCSTFRCQTLVTTTGTCNSHATDELVVDQPKRRTA